MQAQETAISSPSFDVPETAEVSPKFVNPSNMYTYRAYFGTYNGTLVYRLNWGIITKSSHVFVEASEGFIGSASYTVHNVAPHDGYVLVRLTVDWGSPIDVYIDYLVING